jgi:hypothetical protein
MKNYLEMLNLGQESDYEEFYDENTQPPDIYENEIVLNMNDILYNEIYNLFTASQKYLTYIKTLFKCIEHIEGRHFLPFYKNLILNTSEKNNEKINEKIIVIPHYNNWKIYPFFQMTTWKKLFNCDIINKKYPVYSLLIFNEFTDFMKIINCTKYFISSIQYEFDNLTQYVHKIKKFKKISNIDFIVGDIEVEKIMYFDMFRNSIRN